MIGLYTSLFLTILWALTIGQPTDIAQASHIITALANCFILANLLLLGLLIAPLQRSEERGCPRILELFFENSIVQLYGLSLLIYPLLSYFIAFALEQKLSPLFSNLILITWALLSGTIIDIFRLYFQGACRYLSPYAITAIIQDKACQEAVSGKEKSFCSWIDSLTELSLKSIDRDNSSQAIEAIKSLSKPFTLYIDRIKKNSDKETEEQANYVLFYLLNQVEMLYNRALDHKFDTVCEALTAVLAKVTLSTAEYKLSMSSFPLHYICNFCKRAQNDERFNLVNRTHYTLEEIARLLIEEVDLIGDLKQSILTLAHHFRTHAKESFRLDKSSNISLLTRPLLELKKIIQHKKVKAHIDYTVLNQALDNILDEFSALSHVMMRHPNAQKDNEKDENKPS